ncbi:MAG: hypothetical protein GKR89_19215 [Candidatus Latescibacteria bacterium]|nr:hypothetical protein [Candidatus Latescibacterota bacterium]
MTIKLDNPYQNLNGQWLRGSFHGHCDENSACASVPLSQSVQWYSDVGAGFVTLTDHDFITDLASMQGRYPGLAFVQGFEYSSRENVVFAGPGVGPLYELPLEEALGRAADLFTMVCHPWPLEGKRDYWTLKKIEALGTLPDGLEVYNGHYGHERARASGRWPLYDIFWDQLLTAGHRIWGFANDDFHDPEDFDNAFNMVQVEEATPQAVIAAVKQGRSYATTGLLLKNIEERDGLIAVETETPCSGRFVGPGGVELSQASGTQFEYRATGEAYIRFQGEGDSGRIFLQPFFLQ